MVFALTPHALVCVRVCVYEHFCRYICCIVHTTRRLIGIYVLCAVCVLRALLLLFFLSRSLLIETLSLSLSVSFSISKQKQQTLHTSPHKHTRKHTVRRRRRQQLVAAAVVAATTITTAINALCLSRARSPTQPTTFTAHKSAVLIFTFSSFRILSNIQVFFAYSPLSYYSLRVFVDLFGCMGGKDDTH